MSLPPVIKPLRNPGMWLALWWTAIAAVLFVCLVPAPLLPPLPKNSDKIEHLLGYFVLAAFAVQVYRRGPMLWLVGVGLVAMGIGIEVMQGAFTATRAQDPYDVLANGLGVAFGLATVFSPWRDLLLRWQRAT